MAASLPLVPSLPNRPSSARTALLTRRIRWCVAATISYNVVEAIVAISAGTIASSTALIGFGLDSVVEVASAAAVAWQFTGSDHERRERTALRVIALSFFALAAYVSVESVGALLGGHRADHSTVGLVLAALSLAVMPLLSAAQRRAGRELGSRSAVADSKQTLLCTYLSGVLLVGLAVNSLFGWWWADAAAALVIAAVAVKEGLDAWRGEACCSRGGCYRRARPRRVPRPLLRGCRPGRAALTRVDVIPTRSSRRYHIDWVSAVTHAVTGSSPPLGPTT